MRTLGILIIGGCIAAIGLGYHFTGDDFLLCTVGGGTFGWGIGRAICGEWN